MKKNKILKVIGIVLSIILVGSLIYLIYSLSLLSNIETFFRIMFSILLILIDIVLIYSIIESSKSKKNKKYIISIIFIVIISALSITGSIVINKVYGKLSNMVSDEVVYKTVLLSIKDIDDIDNIENIKIGIVDNEEDITGYILPYELIEKYKLDKTNEIVKVSDTITLMSKLLKEEVDAIFISSNYKSMFKTLEDYDESTVLKEIYTYSKNYEKKDIAKDQISTKTEITNPFTVLILGIDSTEDGLNASDSYNGDTIMLLSVDPETMHVTMFSIPRDTYVTMACGGNITKINAAAWGGTRCMVKTVEKLTGIDIDYYVTINFRGVVDLVNSVGGITIDVPMTFCEQMSDRYTELCLDAGVQHLDGEEALAVARHRKTLPLGDFQRGQNQQIVLEGMINSVKSLRSITDFYNVLDAVSKNIDTNMSTDEMLSLYNIAKNVYIKTGELKPNITKTFLTGYSLMEWVGYGYTYTFQYYRQSLEEIVNALKVNLKLKDKEIIKKINFSINEPYERDIVGYTYYNEAKKATMEDLSEYRLSSALSYLEANGFTVDIEYVPTDGVYYDGQIINQSIHDGVLLEKCSRYITLTVAKEDETYIDQNDEGNSEDDEEEIDDIDNNEQEVDPVNNSDQNEENDSNDNNDENNDENQ